MGIFSVGARLVSKVLPKAIKPVAKKAYRVAKAMPDMIFGTSADAFGSGFKAARGSKLMSRLKSGFRSVEADIAAKSAGHGNFFKRTFKSLVDLPKDLYKGAKSGFTAARAASKSGVWGAVKGFGKAIAKKMPLIGVALTALIDGPEVYNAFKEGGFKEGMKELGGVGIELGGMAAGAAIGSCFGPVGTIIGGIVGAIGGALVRGKTYSERKDEAQQQQLYNDLKAMGLSDEEVEYCIENGITPDDVKKALEQPEKSAQPEQPTEPEQPAQPEQPEQPAPTPVPAPVVTPNPVDPTQPTDPTQPVQPTDPTQPEQPADVTKPSQMSNEELIIMLAMIFQQLQQELMAHDERMVELLRQQTPQSPSTEPTAPAAPTKPADEAEETDEADEPANTTNPFAPVDDEYEEEEIDIDIHIGKDNKVTVDVDDPSNPFNDNNYDKEYKIKYAA